MRTLPATIFFLILLFLIFIATEFFQRPVVATQVDTETTPVEPQSTSTVRLTAGMTREAIVAAVGDVLDLDAKTTSKLQHTYRSMQWDHFNKGLEQYMQEKHDLTEDERAILLTHSTIYLDQENDVLESLYVPGEYAFMGTESVVETASVLLERAPTNTAVFVGARIDPDREADLLAYIQGETELLPDLVPLPPQDVSIVDEGGRQLLVFTTIYYNRGSGDLMLHADPETINVPGDIDRDVYQRILRTDGTFRERHAGTFEWHQEHIHYHFADFIAYQLEGLDNSEVLGGDGLLQKSTFCIRDVSRVHLDEVVATSSATYRVCGRERQGVTVGWGDAYFSTYADQNLDVTGLPSGTYRLTFTANPADRFDEVTKENNVASADIRYNAEEGTVDVLSTSPSELPEFEHIHVKQDF